MTTTPCDVQDRADMARLAEGHDAALDALMQRHGERLFHYLIRVLRDEQDAGDVAQETFARLYINRARFDSSKKFSTWLYTIATNIARDHLRRRARHPTVSIEAAADSDAGLAEMLASAQPTASETLQERERVEFIRCAVANLPEDLRLPLVLAEYEDHSQAEIAEVVGCTVKAVEMRLYRARQALRRSLAPLLESIKE